MKKIKVPLFPVQLRLSIVSKLPGNNTAGLTEYFPDSGKIIVYLKPNPDTSTIVHESVHVVQYIEQYVENPFDMETFAYLTQYIFENIFRLSKNKT